MIELEDLLKGKIEKLCKAILKNHNEGGFKSLYEVMEIVRKMLKMKEQNWLKR